LSQRGPRLQQGVAPTGRNRTGPPCSVGRPTAHVPVRQRAGRPRARRPAGPPAGSVTDDDRRQPAKQYRPIRRASNNVATQPRVANSRRDAFCMSCARFVLRALSKSPRWTLVGY